MDERRQDRANPWADPDALRGVAADLELVRDEIDDLTAVTALDADAVGNPVVLGALDELTGALRFQSGAAADDIAGLAAWVHGAADAFADADADGRVAP